MKKAWADKWVKALRSGKYKQSTYKLKKVLDNEVVQHCCLGVLCDILKVKHGLSEVHLPQEAQSISGMKSANGILKDDRGNIEKILTDLNDDGLIQHGPLTFDEIADLIQMTWKEL